MTSVVDLVATRDERVLVWGRYAAEAQYCALNYLSTWRTPQNGREAIPRFVAQLLIIKIR